MSDANPVRATRNLWRFLLAIATLAVTAGGIGLIAAGGAEAAPRATSVGPLSDTVAVTTAPATGGPTLNTSPFPPSAPTNLTATAVHTTSITLSWTASTQGCCPVTGYDVIYGESFNDLLYVVHAGNLTTATITNMIHANGQFFFNVQAHDDLGHNSNYSPRLTVMTPASDTAADQTAPSAPASLTGTNLTATTIDLSWSPSTDNVGVVGYSIYNSDGLVGSTLVATITGTSYTAPLTRSSNHFFVRARDAAGNLSLASNTVDALASSPPPYSSPPNPSKSVSPPPQLSCKVAFSWLAQWQSGFVAGITITNTGSTPIVGWTLTFTMPGDVHVTSSWSSSWTQTGASVWLRNLDWNSTIAPGGSASMGLQGTSSGTLVAPTGFALNGVPCATA
jgi:Cellulose binding domain/Fibronectin type III domain